MAAIIGAGLMGRMDRAPDDIWFPAKRYGWGWGLPCRWQGWIVLIAYVVLLSWAPWSIGLVGRPGLFAVYALGLTGLMFWICYRKGEKPRWRWGDE